MEDFSYVLANYKDVTQEIKKTCDLYNKNLNDIQLIAVSKNFEIDKIKVLVDYGVKDFGESRVQEFLPKYEAFLGEDVNWHFIGHLQKNKVKYIVDKVKYIHSVDSYDLAKKISDECVKKDVCVNIFLQVNIGNDINKFGFSKDEILEQYEKIFAFENINVVGIMTILPNVPNADFVDNLYSEMYALTLDILANLRHNSSKVVLSMGMSNDYKYAIKNNTNFIRVGTSIFGKRY